MKAQFTSRAREILAENPGKSITELVSMGLFMIDAPSFASPQDAERHARAVADQSALERDAMRWRFRMAFLQDGGAFMYGQGGRCMLYRKGECVAAADNEQDAIDAALRCAEGEEFGK